MTGPQRAVSREEIERYLAENDLPYQRIDLPYGLATRGADRSATAAKVFPADLAGQSVLDIGSYLGFFCHEAKRRGASRVVGADVDPVRLAHASRLAAFAGHDIEFRLFDVDLDEMREGFDVVLLLNVVHHALRPVEVLRKVSRIARRRLVLEVPGLDEPAMDRYLRRRHGLRSWHAKKLRDLPLMGIGRNLYYFTPEAIRNVLLEHGRLFANVEILPSDKPGRFVAIAHRRRIGELVVVAGPAGVGKAALVERLVAGTDPSWNARLRAERPESWRTAASGRLGALRTPDVPRLLFQYDLLRAGYGDKRTYARDPELDLFECASRARVVTLWCPGPVLAERFLAGPLPSDPRKRARAERIAAAYRRPGALREIYERWTAHCSRAGVEVEFLDVTSAEPRLESADALPRVLASL